MLSTVGTPFGKPAGSGSDCHTPDRSGLPSLALGVFAVRSAFPSRVRGIELSEVLAHWADAFELRHIRKANAATISFIVSPSALRLSLARTCEKFLSRADQDDDFRICDIGAALRTAALDGDSITELECISTPTSPDQDVGTSHLQSPVLHASGRIFDVDIKPGMRILPFHLSYGARKLDGFVRVELGGKCVMGANRRVGNNDNQTKEQDAGKDSHRKPPAEDED